MQLALRQARQMGSPLRDHGPQRTPLHQGHHHVNDPFELAIFIDRKQRRTRETCAPFRLATELRQSLRVECTRRRQQFQRDLIIKRRDLDRLPNLSLAALSQPLDQNVAAQPATRHHRDQRRAASDGSKNRTRASPPSPTLLNTRAASKHAGVSRRLPTGPTPRTRPAPGPRPCSNPTGAVAIPAIKGPTSPLTCLIVLSSRLDLTNPSPHHAPMYGMMPNCNAPIRDLRSAQSLVCPDESRPKVAVFLSWLLGRASTLLPGVDLWGRPRGPRANTTWCMSKRSCARRTSHLISIRLSRIFMTLGG